MSISFSFSPFSQSLQHVVVADVNMDMDLSAADRPVQALPQRHQQQHRDAVAGGDDDGQAFCPGQRRTGRADPVEAGGDRLEIQLADACRRPPR